MNTWARTVLFACNGAPLSSECNTYVRARHTLSTTVCRLSPSVRAAVYCAAVDQPPPGGAPMELTGWATQFTCMCNIAGTQLTRYFAIEPSMSERARIVCGLLCTQNAALRARCAYSQYNAFLSSTPIGRIVVEILIQTSFLQRANLVAQCAAQYSEQIFDELINQFTTMLESKK